MPEQQPSYNTDWLMSDPDQLTAFGKDSEFSHQGLVHMSYIKCINASAQEMRKGFWQARTDKFGNLINTYHEDTRLQFISCVDTLLVAIISDEDTEFQEERKKITEAINKLYNDLATAEDSWYTNLHPSIRRNTLHIKGRLNQELVFYQHFIETKREFYLQLWGQIELLLKRTKYFRKSLNETGKRRSDDD